MHIGQHLTEDEIKWRSQSTSNQPPGSELVNYVQGIIPIEDLGTCLSPSLLEVILGQTGGHQVGERDQNREEL